MRKIKNCFIVIILALLLSVSFKTSILAQSATESGKPDYQLPYPGLLPDNPLYFIKVLRDNAENFLISDPLIKASFDLRNADKRFSMGLALFDKKKFELCESTISKGQNYLEEGIRNLENSKKEGRQIEVGLLSNYFLSTEKHKEILQSLIGKSTGKLQDKLKKDLKREEKFSEMVSRLRL